MVQVDLPAAFTLGQLLALASSKYLKKTDGLVTNKLLGPFNIYLTAGFIPVGMFLMVAWPSWEVMYTTDWVENTFNNPMVASFYVVFMLAMIFLGNIGFMLGHYCYRKGKDKIVTYTAILGAFLTILPFLLRWGVWMQVGTYSQIQSKTGYSFWQPPFFYGWLFWMSYCAITLIIALAWFRKKGSNL